MAVPPDDPAAPATARIADWLRGAGELRLPDSADFTREVLVTGISEPRRVDRWIEFTVTLRGRPVLLGAEQNAACNQAHPFAGTAPCFLRAEFALDADNTSEIALSCGAEQLRLVGAFSAGDAFAVDFERGVVYRSGQTANALLSADSRFFGTPPGERTVALSRKTAGVWQELDGTLAYRPRWYA